MGGQREVRDTDKCQRCAHERWAHASEKAESTACFLLTSDETMCSCAEFVLHVPYEERNPCERCWHSKSQHMLLESGFLGPCHACPCRGYLGRPASPPVTRGGGMTTRQWVMARALDASVAWHVGMATHEAVEVEGQQGQPDVVTLEDVEELAARWAKLIENGEIDG